MTVVLRWLFWFSCFVTVLIAIVTSTGRMLVPWLDDLEPQINSLLGARGIELRGFNGDWRGLNPIISAHSIRFNGGYARDVVLELDLLESALHSALVARRVSVGTVEVALVRSPASCALFMMSSQPCAVVVATSPSRSSTVVVADSTIAGPLMIWPGTSAAKSRVGTVRHPSR